MNAADGARTERSEHDELLRRLDGISDGDLPFRAQRPIKEHLMREIAQAEQTTRRRSRRPLFLSLGVVAAACAVAVTFTLSGKNPEEPAKAARPEPAAVQLLDRVALAAGSAPAPVVRDGQFLYTKTVARSVTLSEIPGGGGKMEKIPTDDSDECWFSVDGSAGWTKRTVRGSETFPPEGSPNLNDPTYRFLESLPTDPELLLKLIYDDTRKQHGDGSGSTTGPDQQAFVAIGDLLRQFQAPPGLSAALYRAAARIPGVVLVPEAKDAAGRTGVAVARVHDDERTEWIFDKQSLRLLGSRTVILKDNSWGKAGETVDTRAIVAQGVTDRAGQLPRE
ncbi:CU044_5270 family protein [Streptomyces sp. NRRL F-4474]|uniref:CU044_5270 family protein n=1 Tax=Streptomyces sp. NRRL F-4474 TaxID=1463851 RepID=UPI00068DF896|nr:CU044_5270 family protein [Streptomyces sp. NRRL F-4474]